MILTNSIAQKHIGEYIDCYRRMFGCYPMQIIERGDGTVMVKDANGVCTHIYDSGFNVCQYDYIFKMTMPEQPEEAE